MESPSRDDAAIGPSQFYLTDPQTLYLRAIQKLASSSAQDLAKAQQILNGLLATDAASADHWVEMGIVLLQSGKTDQADYCFLRAHQLSPDRVETLLSLANFYLRTRRAREALPYLGRILSYTAQFDDTVFNGFETLGLNFDEIAAGGGMPALIRPARAYLNHLIAAGDVANSQKLWAWMKPYSPNDRLAEEYINFLLGKKMIDEATTAWESRLEEREAGFGTSTFVVNGGFERELSGTLFDWRVEPSEHVQVGRDGSVVHSGHSSLRIAFDGKENVNFQGVSQRVFLRPGTYRFEAFVRTEGITTDEGVSLRVFDVQASSPPLIETEKVRGTTNWQRLAGTLRIPSTTKLVEIQLARHPSLRFDNQIAGVVWIDQVSLTRVN